MQLAKRKFSFPWGLQSYYVLRSPSETYWKPFYANDMFFQGPWEALKNITLCLKGTYPITWLSCRKMLRDYLSSDNYSLWLDWFNSNSFTSSSGVLPRFFNEAAASLANGLSGYLARNSV